MTLERRIYPFDQNGHGLTREDEIDLTHWWITVDFGVERGIDLFESAKSSLISSIMGGGNCNWCGIRPRLDFDREKVWAVEPCKAVDGARYSIELAVPSGEIVLSDDLRPVYPRPNDHDTFKYGGINTAAGQRLEAELLAETGCAYGQVGNCPRTLYKVDDDHYVMAFAAWDQENDEEYPLPAEWEYIGGTDGAVWCYMAADAADYDRRFVEAKARIDAVGVTSWNPGSGLDYEPYREFCHLESLLEDPPKRFKMKPGIYTFTHHFGERGFDEYGEDGQPVVLTHIERRDLG